MLETIWFALWGILWAVYFVLDGFDFGVGTLAPFIAKNESEKRTVYNSMAPYWNGNEVWLITAGGVTFAAFPKTYAVMFSSLYSALLLILFCLIVRGVAMEFRSKICFRGLEKLLGRPPVDRKLRSGLAVRRGFRQSVSRYFD